MVKHLFKQCTLCDAILPMPQFRRWKGAKRVYGSACLTCKPERPLSALSPKEQLRTVYERNLSQSKKLQALRAAERHADRISAMRHHQARAMHEAARLEEWKRAVLDSLDNERQWLRKRIAGLRHIHAIYEHPNPAQWRTLATMAKSQAWVGFGHCAKPWLQWYEAYLGQLSQITEAMRAHIRNQTPATQPTAEQANPVTWARQALTHLRATYAELPSLPNGIQRREPLLLGWDFSA